MQRECIANSVSARHHVIGHECIRATSGNVATACPSGAKTRTPTRTNPTNRTRLARLRGAGAMAEAILAFLRTDRRKCFDLWRVLNQIVSESCQCCRFDVRAATFEALGELMQLRRERAVYRHRRRWIAILDLETPLPPLD